MDYLKTGNLLCWGLKMEVYLLMLYVTVEQEVAIKDLFVQQGWKYRKDATVTETEDKYRNASLEATGDKVDQVEKADAKLEDTGHIKHEEECGTNDEVKIKVEPDLGNEDWNTEGENLQKYHCHVGARDRITSVADKEYSQCMIAYEDHITGDTNGHGEEKPENENLKCEPGSTNTDTFMYLYHPEDFRPPAPRKLNLKSFQTKYTAIMEIEKEEKSKTEIAKEIGVPLSTLCTWVTHKNEIIKSYFERGGACRRKKKRKGRDSSESLERNDTCSAEVEQSNKQNLTSVQAEPMDMGHTCSSEVELHNKEDTTSSTPVVSCTTKGLIEEQMNDQCSKDTHPKKSMDRHDSSFTETELGDEQGQFTIPSDLVSSDMHSRSSGAEMTKSPTVGNTKRYRCKRKLKSRTIETKYNAILEVEKGEETLTQVAKKIQVPVNTLCTWCKNSVKIKEAYLQCGSSEFKRNSKKLRQSPGNVALELALVNWMYDANRNNIPVSGRMIVDKAKQYASKFGLTDFRCSNGWFHRFKLRNDITLDRGSVRRHVLYRLPDDAPVEAASLFNMEGDILQHETEADMSTEVLLSETEGDMSTEVLLSETEGDMSTEVLLSETEGNISTEIHTSTIPSPPKLSGPF